MSNRYLLILIYLLVCHISHQKNFLEEIAHSDNKGGLHLCCTVGTPVISIFNRLQNRGGSQFV